MARAAAPAHVEAARAAEELELGVAVALGEDLVRAPSRLGGADALQQCIKLNRPAECRCSCLGVAVELRVGLGLSLDWG